eukprot:gnl/TRDRNA2_/TRDRNA2_48133_c0_seq1.p1 gnl/TRDRNA2_/TRDRNA2_48133_c0~~gnl/TRDRNA2_/TRDRNA2_48133_c0_seq1.p1  ORF type:complete len:252 (+),score=28.67 gnl/TRDRNA2_/TRDRNA2_48133_c0_seq1:50-757(+)
MSAKPVNVADSILSDTFLMDERMLGEVWYTDPAASGKGTSYPHIQFSTPVRRFPNFYVYNIMLPLFCLVPIPIACPAIMDSRKDRLSATLTVLLTVVAFKFTTTNYVPPVSYLTYLDYYMTGAMFFVLMAAIQTIAFQLYACGGVQCSEKEMIFEHEIRDQVEWRVAQALLLGWVLFGVCFAFTAVRVMRSGNQRLVAGTQSEASETGERSATVPLNSPRLEARSQRSLRTTAIE